MFTTSNSFVRHPDEFAFDTHSLKAYFPAPLQRYSPPTPTFAAEHPLLWPLEINELSAKARVLIVDSSPESRDILQTLLERQGTETLVASANAGAMEILEHHQPDLVVYNADCDQSPTQEDTHALGRSASRSDTPIVVLGTAKRHLSPLPTGQLVTKPYHYGPLIRRIEGLLGS